MQGDIREVMNFKEFVDKIDEIYDELKRRKLLTHNSIAYNPESWKVKIKTAPKEGYFGTFCINVKDVTMGIDWDDGTIFITSDVPLYEEAQDVDFR